MLPYFMEKLKAAQEGDKNLLDKTLIVYGSPMANGNNHNHRNCPLILLGKGGGMLEGGVHVKAANDTPMANVHDDADQQARRRPQDVRGQHRGILVS